jgi:hypothetical protein
VYGLEEVFLEDTFLEALGQKAPSASSRERPQVVWVRSLMSKERKVGLLGDLVGHGASPGHLCHSPELPRILLTQDLVYYHLGLITNPPSSFRKPSR